MTVEEFRLIYGSGMYLVHDVTSFEPHVEAEFLFLHREP